MSTVTEFATGLQSSPFMADVPTGPAASRRALIEDTLTGTRAILLLLQQGLGRLEARIVPGAFDRVLSARIDAYTVAIDALKDIAQ